MRTLLEIFRRCRLRQRASPHLRKVCRCYKELMIKKKIWPALAALVLIAADQAVKLAVAANYSLYDSHPIIKGVLEFYYLHNDGAAMGMMSGARWYLIAVTAVVIILLIAYMFSKKASSVLLTWSLAFIVSGGIGNLIDRIRLGYVIDFVRFPISWFNFSFNIADCAVVIGGCMLALYLVLDIFKSGRKHGK